MMEEAITSKVGIGDIVRARVEAVMSFGLVLSFGGGVRGFIDVLQLAPTRWQRVDWDALPEAGSEIEATVIYYHDDGRGFRLSLRDEHKYLRARWELYRGSVDRGAIYTGRITWCRNGDISVDISVAPFMARLVGSSLDAHNWDNEGRIVCCRIVGFDDRLMEVLVKPVELLAV